MDNRLSALLEKDSHGDDCGQYEIHSLYFDDYKDTCAKENEAGIAKRSKYRIRYYGSQSQFLKLECKEKINSLCYKESCFLSLEEYQKIMDGNIEELFFSAEKKLLKQFCLQSMTKHFTPKAIIDYKRTAYTEEITNVRVTLDVNMSASDDFAHFLDGGYMQYPFPCEGKSVLEVKFDDIMPGYIRHVITHRNLVQSAFSKYCIGRRTLQNMKR